MKDSIYFTLLDKVTGKSYSATLFSGESVSVGRLPENGKEGLKIETVSPLITRCISRDHLSIVAVDFGSGLELHALDLCSRNGSFVNGNKIGLTRPAALHDSDKLGFGCGNNSHYDFTLKIETGRPYIPFAPYLNIVEDSSLV